MHEQKDQTPINSSVSKRLALVISSYKIAIGNIRSDLRRRSLFSRQPKCIPIIATQSISSLRSALPGESWRTLLQTFRTKIFFSLSDDFSARTASDFCGREDQLKVSYSLSESGHDTKVSWLTGKALSHKANIVASNSYNTLSDYRFDNLVLARRGIEHEVREVCGVTTTVYASPRN
jgi:hypothetical protein